MQNWGKYLIDVIFLWMCVAIYCTCSSMKRQKLSLKLQTYFTFLCLFRTLIVCMFFSSHCFSPFTQSISISKNSADVTKHRAQIFVQSLSKLMQQAYYVEQLIWVSSVAGRRRQLLLYCRFHSFCVIFGQSNV